MASWLSAAAPLIPEVIRLATPYFSKKPVEQLPDLAASVAELQDAVRTNADALTRNAEALESFAADTRRSIEALQVQAAATARELRLLRHVATAALTVAVLAFGLAAYALAQS
ncbi:hypothetical protein [Cognatiluteimonas lumbrici]|uniref:hypothetical protein n=1 Tax=Cognatiluteimonas lumbrici TaxID=2559601 RepID=UPI00112D2399|nr:hypothetical protein [Luteimonas lumbrici]